MQSVLKIAVGVIILMSTLPTGAQTPATADIPIRIVDAAGYHIGVYVVNRPKATKPVSIYHETRVAEVYHMLEGAGTLVTGGTMNGPIAKEAPGTLILSVLNNVRGTTITGGTTRRIAKGDVVVIPGYLPHWWSEVESDMSYLVIRPDPDNTLPLK